MSIDKLFDKMEKRPVVFIVAWLFFSLLLSLVGIALAVVVVVAILNGFGVL